MPYAIRGLIGFVIWIIAIVLFFVWGFTYGEAKPSTIKTIADILVIIDIISGITAFVAMVYYAGCAVTGHGKKDVNKADKVKGTGKLLAIFQYIIATFAIAVGLSVIFVLCSLPFQETASGTMSFCQVPNSLDGMSLSFLRRRHFEN